jgi:hypothetical protein
MRIISCGPYALEPAAITFGTETVLSVALFGKSALWDSQLDMYFSFLDFLLNLANFVAVLFCSMVVSWPSTAATLFVTGLSLSMKSSP